MKCIKIALFLLTFLLCNTLIAQIYEFDFNFKSISKPSIKVDCGFDYSSLKEENKTDLTNSLNSFGIVLGVASNQDLFSITKKIKYAFSKDTMSIEVKESLNANLTSNSFWGLGISYILDGSDTSAHNLIGLYVIGPIDLEGAGYKFANNVSLKLLTGRNITWYAPRISKPRLDSLALVDELANYPDIRVFGSSVRFGERYQSEISFQFMKNVSVYCGANRLVVFPRTLFWKWAGSEILYSIGDGALSYFTNKIKTSSPYAYPVVDFILKTGLYYGISELQRSKMNFPFNTAPALLIDQYRAGIQFDF
ncbi:MAG: hypothetical protein FWG85_06185 [Bacteroidetes bacterium]|nr:hypothetical protein [Bacteroidota bacterium]